MCISSTSTTRQSFYPSILTFDFNKYSFFSFDILYRTIRLKSVFIIFFWIVYLFYFI